MRAAFGLVIFGAVISAFAFAETKAAPASAGKRIYAANCVTCHGPDGKGNSTGRAMGVKDLHSPDAVKLSDEQMKKVITSGKGNMPPWSGQLSEAQIAEVAAFVRSLQKSGK